MSTFFDHEIIEQLHESARSVVYRARAADGTALIVKVCNQEFPSFQQLAQFKREYAIGRRFRHPGIVHPLALRLHRGRWTMVQEDIGGLSLDKVLLVQPSLALDEFFEVAMQLCAALDEVHRQGVIHKDVNPSNLVWNRERCLLQLIDFGIACELPSERQNAVSPHALEGTLRYMAPEQTGRMNRRVDYRADFYAVGATFYELLAGHAPFDAGDPMALVHCHIARSPDWSHPALLALPGSLPAILQRLLEKNPELRYQSLQGLRRDLASCRDGMTVSASTQPFLLSNHDKRFLVPQTLHGREEAIGTLLSAFERSAAGTGEMVLVAGYSGVGKSAVVHEMHKPVVARRGYFLTGKFNQFWRDVPYASLIQAFQQLVRQLLGEPDEVLRHWARTLRDALGSGLDVMVELIPELALIAGPTGAVPALAPEQARLRLGRVFPRFVQAFATADHPLVLFLDDLQWADAATLRMIELCMVAPGMDHLLVIGAYRVNEVDALHPVSAWRGKLGAAGVRLSTLTLGPLTEPQVAQVVAATVRATVADCAALTRLCFVKTAGNPFFLGQFLGLMHDAGHLVYRAADDCWDADLAAIERAHYTDNVVELLLDKIGRLPAATRRLLQLAASVGNRFALDTLALATGCTAWHTQRDLWPALDAGLIQPLDERYKYIDTDAPDSGIGYRFLHDRVQQAAYLVADAGARRANHLRIGRLLLRQATDDGDEDNVFEIVEQLNAGRALIDAAAERVQLARLNLRAAGKARRTAAFQVMLDYMRVGLDLLPADAWHAHAELWLDLQLGEAEAAYLCGQFDVANAIYPLVRTRATAPLAQVRCIAVQAHQYQLQGRLLDAIAVLRDGLAQLGIDIPHDVAHLQACFDALFAELGQRAGADAPEALLGAREMCDPGAVAAMHMMQGLWMASYYAGQQDLAALMVLSMTRLSMQEGNSDFSAVAYVGYAFWLAMKNGDTALGYRFGAMALALARNRTNLQTRALTAVMFAALTNHWTRPLRSSDAIYEEAFGWALEIGDYVQVGVAAGVRATERLILGDYLPQLMQDIERDLVLMRANGQHAMADCCVAAAIQPIKCLMGLTPRGDSYDDATFNEADYLARYGGSPLYTAYFLQGKIRNAYLFDGADAEALADRLDIVTRLMRGQAKVPESSFYAALILLRAMRRNPARVDAAALQERIDALQANLSRWAELGPDNLRAKCLLVEAETARGRYDLPLAARRYQQAIDEAGQAGYVNIQALASELCGECWFEQGQPRVAAVFLKDAVARYGQWGAEGKVAQLRARYGTVLARVDGLATRTRTATQGASALDVMSLLKATRILSNEVGLRNVLRRLMSIARENSGAQIARLLLLSDGLYRLEADIDDNDIVVLHSRPLDLDAASDRQLPLSVLRYVIRTGAEVIEDDIVTSARFGADAYVRENAPRAVMCLPVRQGGGIEGVLYFENRLTTASFTEERVGFQRMLGVQAMISIASARLHDSLEQRVAERTAQLEQANRKLAALAITDGLTGLANRRHFDEALGTECARAARSGRPLAVIMLDVDHFKKFNDRYGHQAGDACLIQVAHILAAAVRRASDLAARYGGEEFAIILPETDAGEASHIAEGLRSAIEQLRIAHAGSAAGQVTISVGIAVDPRQGGGNPDALLRRADSALYRAKHGGRNRVVLDGLE